MLKSVPEQGVKTSTPRRPAREAAAAHEIPLPEPPPVKKVAMALSGGGAYAAYELGVMRAVMGGETQSTGCVPVHPEIFTGTSAGALNACLMAAHSVDPPLTALGKVQNVWLNDIAGNNATATNGVLHIRFNPFSLGTLNEMRANPLRPLAQLASDTLAVSGSLIRHGADFLFSTGSLPARAMELVDLSSLVSVAPLRETLMRVLDLDAIRNSRFALRIAATNWTTGGTTIFRNADFEGDAGYSAIMASTAIPGIFPPVEIGDCTYVDGGLLMNSPLEPAITAGATEIHIVYLDPDLRSIPLMRLQSTPEVLQRSLAIAFAGNANSDIENARSINQGLAILHANRPGAPGTSASVKPLLRTLSRIQRHSDSLDSYRRLTIHRYHPTDELGGGLGILDFSRDAIERLIDRGFQDGIRHDCEQSGCVLAH